ncbi:MAG TPA: EutN/CcmL family microcompartment protein [Anaerovoracaceae bacterium]|nr:EutN/CcmL family microcompartment protein [Anaerovoracaceae bacterium]
MIIGIVLDSIWCTRKEETLTGIKLMTVKLLDKENPKEGDIIGAGVGEKVLVTQGSSARRAVGFTESPVDATIVGIIDEKAV